MIAAAFRASLSALVLFAVLSPVVWAQFGSKEPATSDEDSKSATLRAVAMEVWVVTFHKVKSVVEDDQFGKTLREAANLPADLGDRSDVRKLLDEWEAQGVVARLENYRATSRSGQMAMIVPTEQSPMVTGTAVSDRAKTNDIQLQQIGSSLTLKPKVVGEHTIDVGVEYEHSELFESESVKIAEIKGEFTQPAVGTKSVTIQSVVAVPNGHAVLVTFISDSKQSSSKLVLIAAEFLEL